MLVCFSDDRQIEQHLVERVQNYPLMVEAQPTVISSSLTGSHQVVTTKSERWSHPGLLSTRRRKITISATEIDWVLCNW
jgi:hypothetical protein